MVGAFFGPGVMASTIWLPLYLPMTLQWMPSQMMLQSRTGNNSSSCTMLSGISAQQQTPQDCSSSSTTAAGMLYVPVFSPAAATAETEGITFECGSSPSSSSGSFSGISRGPVQKRSSLKSLSRPASESSPGASRVRFADQLESYQASGSEAAAAASAQGATGTSSCGSPGAAADGAAAGSKSAPVAAAGGQAGSSSEAAAVSTDSTEAAVADSGAAAGRSADGNWEARVFTELPELPDCPSLLEEQCWGGEGPTDDSGGGSDDGLQKSGSVVAAFVSFLFGGAPPRAGAGGGEYEEDVRGVSDQQA